MDLSKIDWRLYAIIDRDFIGNRSIKNITEALAKGGTGVIQLRDKSGNIRRFYDDAVQVREVTRHFDLPFIINDRTDVALAAEADGVHVGQADLPVEAVRGLIGNDKIIGISVHSLEEFERSVGGKPTYFGVGTIYASSVKSQLPATGTAIIQKIRAQTETPLIAIGGIDIDNLAAVFHAGADGVAVISSLFNARDIGKKAFALISEMPNSTKTKF